jgi:glyoxylase-like metal-dependent hydrolase (beta-lactamase superfamily II)
MSHETRTDSHVIADGIRLVDLLFGGEPRSIASAVIDASAGLVIVDPGPSTTLDVLEGVLAERHATWEDVRAILLTHLHLDHAGATGTITGRSPWIQVFAHSSAAPHLADPRRLLRSAARIFGDDLERLWGVIAPVSPDRIVSLGGGETLDVGGRAFSVAWTPGHANHHVCFLDTSSGTAFVGDAAGVRIAAAEPVVPVTPPPDIDLDAWRESARRVLEWKPCRLLLTHYGCVSDPVEHFDRHQAALDSWETRVRADLRISTEGDHSALASRFAAAVGSDLVARVGKARAREYLRSVGPEECWHGLARYCARHQ